MTLKDTTLQMLQKYQVRAQKKLGQNFLIDENILDQIIEVAAIKTQDVVEIGPGLGHLTQKILAKQRLLWVYEIDPLMIKILKQEYQSAIAQKQLTIMPQDFLKAPFDWNEKRQIIANLPYYITSDILFKIFANISKFSSAVLMVQNEVADRLVAPLGSKHYGKLTVSANYFATITKAFVVPHTAFLPMPKVQSAVIHLKFNKQQRLDSQQFLLFVKNCFSARRKTLANNLKLFIKTRNIAQLVATITTNAMIRPQQLTVLDFMKLYQECYR